MYPATFIKEIETREVQGYQLRSLGFDVPSAWVLAYEGVGGGCYLFEYATERAAEKAASRLREMTGAAPEETRVMPVARAVEEYA